MGRPVLTSTLGELPWRHGNRRQVLEGAQIGHDSDARSQRSRRWSGPADDGAARGRHPRPHLVFSAKDVDLVQATGGGAPALLHFASKGHDLFASVTGRLIPDNDP